jgi:hypothetical protein
MSAASKPISSAIEIFIVDSLFPPDVRRNMAA